MKNSPAEFRHLKFIRWQFYSAGIYGLLVLIPMFFTEVQTGIDYPPEITHPEFYYGFIGTAVAWQLVFLLIGSDPVRFKKIILAAWVEKFSFAIAGWILLSQNRIPAPLFAGSQIDLILGISFTWAWFRIPDA